MESALSKTTIYQYFSVFKRDNSDTDEAKRLGRPNKVITPENIKKTFDICVTLP